MTGRQRSVRRLAALVVAAVAWTVAGCSCHSAGVRVVAVSSDDMVRHTTLAYFMRPGYTVKYTKNRAADGAWRLDGRFVIVDQRGRKVYKGAYAHGLWHGEWTYWHSNGRVGGTWHYDKGQPIGVRSFWDEKGNLIHRTAYRNGVKHGRETHWDASGRPFVNCVWTDGEPERVDVYEAGALTEVYEGQEARQWLMDSSRGDFDPAREVRER